MVDDDSDKSVGHVLNVPIYRHRHVENVPHQDFYRKHLDYGASLKSCRSNFNLSGVR